MHVLTGKVKRHALQLGADLVGVANIGRYEHAPLMMSPQGILPDAKSVVVMALHHPDGCIEMGGEPEPQDLGPYRVQYTMNSMLDELSFKMGRFIEDLGFKTVPIASSNIWRYRGYKGLRENFAPDVSHMHAAVAAGLADFGYSGLALTPEYGARQRFVQVITTAELEPTPLIRERLCDMCKECIAHCPSGALSKEVNGLHRVRIEDRTFTYANKNLWRCAWGEHFDLDLMLDIPENVTEDAILDNVKAHGLRGGEFGCCLRFCLPKSIRTHEPDYTRAPRRKKAFTPPPAPDSKLLRKLENAAESYGCLGIATLGPEALEEQGIAPAAFLPDAKSAVLVFSEPPEEEHGRLQFAAQKKADFAAYRIARLIEDAGYSVVTHSPLADDERATLSAAVEFPGHCRIQTVFTSAELPTAVRAPARDVPAADVPLADALRRAAKALGVDLVGVASAERLDAIARQLAPQYEGAARFAARDRAPRFQEYRPEITREKISPRTADEIFPGMKSAVVLGLHYHTASVERAGRPPAETVGPYAFARYEAQFLLTSYALDIAALLRRAGFRAGVDFDPLGLGGMMASPREELYDHFACRFAAVAAGLATLTKSGHTATREFGLNQTFIAVVTDAVLEPDAIQHFDPCSDCEDCLAACPTAAFKSGRTAFEIGGQVFSFRGRDLDRCDWSKRYTLVAGSGFGAMGSRLDEAPPAKVTEKALAAALKKHNAVTKYRPYAAEKCILECRLARWRKGDGR